MMTKNLRFRSAGPIPTELTVRRLADYALMGDRRRARGNNGSIFARTLPVDQSSRFIQGSRDSEAANHSSQKRPRFKQSLSLNFPLGANTSHVLRSKERTLALMISW